MIPLLIAGGIAAVGATAYVFKNASREVDRQLVTYHQLASNFTNRALETINRNLIIFNRNLNLLTTVANRQLTEFSRPIERHRTVLNEAFLVSITGIPISLIYWIIKDFQLHTEYGEWRWISTIADKQGCNTAILIWSALRNWAVAIIWLLTMIIGPAVTGGILYNNSSKKGMDDIPNLAVAILGALFLSTSVFFTFPLFFTFPAFLRSQTWEGFLRRAVQDAGLLIVRFGAIYIYEDIFALAWFDVNSWRIWFAFHSVYIVFVFTVRLLSILLMKEAADKGKWHIAVLYLIIFYSAGYSLSFYELYAYIRH